MQPFWHHRNIEFLELICGNDGDSMARKKNHITEGRPRKFNKTELRLSCKTMKNGKSLGSTVFLYTPPPKTNILNPKMKVWKMKILLEVVISGSMLVLGGISQNHILLDWKLFFLNVERLCDNSFKSENCSLLMFQSPKLCPKLPLLYPLPGMTSFFLYSPIN